MIRIGFETAVGFFLSAVFILFMFLWWRSFRRKKSTEEWNITDHVQRCPYCGHVFAGQESRGSMKCPVCESYLEVQKCP